MWKITFSDGTILDNLKLSGNNFISKSPLEESFFHGKLNNVLIEAQDDELDMFALSGLHKHMRLDALRKYPDGWYFVLNDISAEELRLMMIEGNIEYIAMMAEVNL